MSFECVALANYMPGAFVLRFAGLTDKVSDFFSWINLSPCATLPRYAIFIRNSQCFP